MQDKENELIDYLQVIIDRKWIIVLGTFLCMALAGIISIFLKPVYEIDAIIQPGKFLIQNGNGNLTEFVVENPQQIANKIFHKSYNAFIAAELGLDEKKLPDIEGSVIRDTILTRILIKSSNIERSKEIIDHLIQYIKKDIDEKVEIEFNNINSLIKENEIKKERKTNDIALLKSKLIIIAQRKKDLVSELDLVRTRVKSLEIEQNNALKKESSSTAEGLSMLLYSNEIQQSYRYYDVLNEKLNLKKMQEKDVNMGINQEYAASDQLDNVIINLKARKGRIEYTKIIKIPTSSVSSVFPRTTLNIIIAAFLGFVIFTFFAFFLEYLKKKKA